MARPGTPLVLACTLLLLILQCCHAAPDNDGSLPETDDFPYHAQLDENFSLQWRFNSTHIMFHTNVKAKGYVGFGVSRNGDMVPGDVVMGWMDGYGVTHFHDRHAKRRTRPEIDQQQDWKLLDLKKEHGQYINMTFIRKLNTCDTEEDIPIEAATTRVIYAYSDAVPFSDDVIPYHGAQTRGTRSLLLLNPQQTDNDATNMPDDVVTVDFLHDHYSVPAADTTYACKIFKLPELQGRHHMIRYEPVIQAGHDKLVHHALIYTCQRNFSERVLDSVFDRFDSQDSVEFTDLSCFRTLMAWAIGGSAFDYPPDVGHSMGGPDDPVYFRLEIHYDNPALRSDYVDSSGFRMYLTKQLRQHDAGMLVVGSRLLLPITIIPPGVPDFLSRGYATPECLDHSGLGTREEMCLSFLLYYPNTQAKFLSSFTTLMYSKNGEPMYPEGVYNFANNANWSNEETLDTFVHNVHTSNVQDHCITSKGLLILPSTQPKVFQEYQPEDVCDPKGDGRVSATSFPVLMIFSAVIASFYIP